MSFGLNDGMSAAGLHGPSMLTLQLYRYILMFGG
jgi:hypothetical protein